MAAPETAPLDPMAPLVARVTARNKARQDERAAAIKRIAQALG